MLSGNGLKTFCFVRIHSFVNESANLRETVSADCTKGQQFPFWLCNGII